MRILKKLSLCSLALAACLGFMFSGSVYAMSHEHDTTDQTVTDTANADHTNNMDHNQDHSMDKHSKEQDTHDTDHDTDHNMDHSNGN